MRRLTVTELSLLEVFFTSLVIGLAETYFPAFSLLKGATPIEAGVLVSAPMIFAILFQWLLLKKFRHLNLSTWVPLAAGIQLLSLFGLTLLATMTTVYPVIWLLVLYSIYWAGFYSAIPAWNRWISDLIPAELGQKYFAARTRLGQIGILSGLLVGGLVLHFYKFGLSVPYLFAGLFSICAVFKFITYKLFRKHTESLATIHFEKSKAINLFKNYKSFFLKYASYNLALYLSAPFVASYLLSARNLSYESFMWVMVGLFSGKIVFTLFMSKTGKQLLPASLLFYGAVVSAPLPILWPLCVNVPLMFGLHFLSGLGLGCLEMGLALSFFKTLKSDEKIEVISIFYFFSVITQIIGAFLGAILLKFVVGENYEVLFVIAGACRLFFALRLKTIKENMN